MISLVVAHDINYGIGKNNLIPWPFMKEDMRLFVKNTKDNIVIMGRKTWESLPKKPLKNRCNVIVSKTIDKCDDAFICNSLEEACYKSGFNAVIIGGQQIYTKALELNLVDTMYISKLRTSYDCDSYFPKYDENLWATKQSFDYKEFDYFVLEKKKYEI